MKTVQSSMMLATAMLSMLLGACATRGNPGNASTEAAAPVASAAPTAAVTPQVAEVAPQPPAVTPPHAAKPAHVPSPPTALETQYGIQITQVGLAASGGLVDVRFKVLDPAKVSTLLGNPANHPMLIAGDKPPLMPPHHALRGARYGKGQVFYILYPNPRGTIQPGTEVTVSMGDVRLGPVTAQ